MDVTLSQINPVPKPRIVLRQYSLQYHLPDSMVYRPAVSKYLSSWPVLLCKTKVRIFSGKYTVNTGSNSVCLRDIGAGRRDEEEGSLTHSLTHSWSSALLEKLAIVQLLKNFSTFYRTRRFITLFTRALHWSLSWARSIQSTLSHPTL
jgi:hypothetical protein